jgi:hypothetical protein
LGSVIPNAIRRSKVENESEDSDGSVPELFENALDEV